jgi:hypothetical protein
MDQMTDRERWFDEHPDVPGRLQDIHTEIEGIERGAHRDRDAVVVELNPDRDRSPKVHRSHDRSSSHDHDLGGGFGM